MNTMKFKTLITMQLKEKINLSFLKSKKQTLFKVVFTLLQFGLVTGAAYLIFFLCNFLSLFSLSNQVPLSVMSVVFAFMYVINLISSTVVLSRSLYESADNKVLITFPVNANLVFLSKLVVHLLGEIKRTFTFLVPIFLAFGISSSLPFIYYIWMPIMFCVLAVVTVLISGIISIPWALIMRFLNKYKVIKLIICILLLGGVGYLAFVLINKIPANINLIESWRTISISMRSFLTKFVQIFGFVYACVIFLCGQNVGAKYVFFTKYSYIVPLILIATIVVLLGLNMLLSRPIYFKALSSSFEFNKNKTRERKNKIISSNLSPLLYEFKKSFRETDLLSNALIMIVISPIAILALNKVYGAINTRLFGDFLTVAFNVLMILLFTLSTNITVSSVYSKEGGSFYLNKTIPKKPYQILFSRLAFHVVLSLLILIPTSSIFFTFAVISTMDKILLFFAMMLISLIHIVWSAEIDFLNIQTERFKTDGKAGINPNELKSTILAFAISLVSFGIVAFFLITDSSGFFAKFLIMALAVLILKTILFCYKSKVLFKEK